PAPKSNEARSRYLLRWAAYWGSWVGQCVVVFAGCWLAAQWRPELAASLWLLALWVVVVPALAAMASVAGVGALVASTMARVVGPDPITNCGMETGEAETSLEG